MSAMDVTASDYVALCRAFGWSDKELKAEFGDIGIRVFRGKCGHFYTGNRCIECIPQAPQHAASYAPRKTFAQKQKRRRKYAVEYQRTLRATKRRIQREKRTFAAKLRAKQF